MYKLNQKFCNIIFLFFPFSFGFMILVLRKNFCEKYSEILFSAEVLKLSSIQLLIIESESKKNLLIINKLIYYICQNKISKNSRVESDEIMCEEMLNLVTNI